MQRTPQNWVTSSTSHKKLVMSLTTQPKSSWLSLCGSADVLHLDLTGREERNYLLSNKW